MVEDPDFWKNLAEQFTQIDPAYRLDLQWIYWPETRNHDFTLDSSRAGRLVEAKFASLASRAGKALWHTDPSDAWLSEIRLRNPSINLSQGVSKNQLTGEDHLYNSGRLIRVCEVSATLCYIYDADFHSGRTPFSFFTNLSRVRDLPAENVLTYDVIPEPASEPPMGASPSTIAEQAEQIERLRIESDREHGASPAKAASETLGEQINRLRQECDLTEEELAEKIDIDIRTVQRHIADACAPYARNRTAYGRIFSKILKRNIVIRKLP
jgi:hypothetical protein